MEILHPLVLAPTNDVWYVNAFSMHTPNWDWPFRIIVEYDGSPPVLLLGRIAQFCTIRRGETVGIRLWAIINLKNHVECRIILEAPDDDERSAAVGRSPVSRDHDR